MRRSVVWTVMWQICPSDIVWYTKLEMMTWTLKSDPDYRRCWDCPLCWWMTKENISNDSNIKNIRHPRRLNNKFFRSQRLSCSLTIHTLITFAKRHAFHLKISCSGGIFNWMPWMDRINCLISPNNPTLLLAPNHNQIPFPTHHENIYNFQTQT